MTNNTHLSGQQSNNTPFWTCPCMVPYFCVVITVRPRVSACLRSQNQGEGDTTDERAWSRPGGDDRRFSVQQKKIPLGFRVWPRDSSFLILVSRTRWAMINHDLVLLISSFGQVCIQKNPPKLPGLCHSFPVPLTF